MSVPIDLVFLNISAKEKAKTTNDAMVKRNTALEPQQIQQSKLNLQRSRQQQQKLRQLGPFAPQSLNQTTTLLESTMPNEFKGLF